MAKHKANRLKDAAKEHSRSISAYFTRNSARPNAAAAQNSTNADTDDNNDTPERPVTNIVAATSTAEDGATLGKVDVASVTDVAPDAGVMLPTIMINSPQQIIMLLREIIQPSTRLGKIIITAIMM